MKVVTIREGEERGSCSAALKEKLIIVKDQIGERSVVVIALNKRLNKLERCCTAEHIKSDKVENVATGASNIGEFGKVGHRDEWNRWKIGEFQN